MSPQVRNDSTGEVAPAHQVGTDGNGRPLYSHVEGWTAIDSSGIHAAIECDADGNWTPAAAALIVADEYRTIVARATGWNIYTMSDDDSTTLVGTASTRTEALTLARRLGANHVQHGLDGEVEAVG